jgi:hypothetical protein
MSSHAVIRNLPRSTVSATAAGVPMPRMEPALKGSGGEGAQRGAGRDAVAGMAVA